MSHFFLVESFILYNPSSSYILIYTFCVFPVSEPTPKIMSSTSFAHCSHETTKTRPDLPEEEVKVDMMVLARKRPMRWQRGKIVDISTRGKKINLFGRKLITTTLKHQQNKKLVQFPASPCAV